MIRINKEKNKDFVILNLTDPQLETEEWEEGHINRKILEYTVSKLINETHPDLITVSGDISSAASHKAYTNFAGMINAYNIPWAVVWGNHDNQGGTEPIRKYVEEYKTYSNFVYEEGPKELGNGNYVIEICEDGKTVHAVIMMDSHDRIDFINEKGEEAKDWAKLIPEQLVWYEKAILDLKEKGCNESTVISHIPVYAYRTAYEKAFNKSYNPEELTFEESTQGVCWNEGYKSSYGLNFEGICSCHIDDGMFELIKKLGSTKLYLCGHDHTNSTCIEYEGIKLMYALKTGRGCYYRAPYNGGTVLKIDSEGKVYAEHHFCDEGI